MALTYWTGGHTKHRLLYHLVWIPQYRKKLLQDRVARRLQHFLYEAAKSHRWWIEAMAILPDHVHLIIQIPPTEPLALVVQRLKGGTSYDLYDEFPDLRKFIRGDRFWAE